LAEERKKVDNYYFAGVYRRIIVKSDYFVIRIYKKGVFKGNKN